MKMWHPDNDLSLIVTRYRSASARRRHFSLRDVIRATWGIKANGSRSCFSFLFFALHFHCFFPAVNFVFFAWLLYGIFFFPPFALLSFLSPLSFLYALVFFLHIFIAFFTSFGLNSFLPLFFRPILDAFISLSLSSLDLSPSQYTRPLCVNLHITVSTLHVHGWLNL